MFILISIIYSLEEQSYYPLLHWFRQALIMLKCSWQFQWHLHHLDLFINSETGALSNCVRGELHRSAPWNAWTCTNYYPYQTFRCFLHLLQALQLEHFHTRWCLVDCRDVDFYSWDRRFWTEFCRCVSLIHCGGSLEELTQNFCGRSHTTCCLRCILFPGASAEYSRAALWKWLIWN